MVSRLLRLRPLQKPPSGYPSLGGILDRESAAIQVICCRRMADATIASKSGVKCLHVGYSSLYHGWALFFISSPVHPLSSVSVSEPSTLAPAPSPLASAPVLDHSPRSAAVSPSHTVSPCMLKPAASECAGRGPLYWVGDRGCDILVARAKTFQGICVSLFCWGGSCDVFVRISNEGLHNSACCRLIFFLPCEPC